MVEERGRAALRGGVSITVVWVRVRSFFTATYCLHCCWRSLESCPS